jgi:hypothetical protein
MASGNFLNVPATVQDTANAAVLPHPTALA